MATYTNLGIKEITTGDESGTWGASTNTNFEYFDTAIVGYKRVTLTTAGTSGSPNTLNIANFAISDGRNRLVEYYSAADLGATCYVQITPNTFQGYYIIRNSLAGARDLVVFQGTYSAPNSITLANGKDYIIRCDGAGTGAVVTQVLQNMALTSLALSTALPIASGGTGQTTASAAFNALSPITSTGDLILGNGVNSATRLAIGTNGYILTSNGTTASWQPAPAAGVTTFSAGTTGLTPSSATSGAITLAGTLAITNGGTGATSAATALSNLGGVSLSANNTFTGTNAFNNNVAVGASTTASTSLLITKNITGGLTSWGVRNSGSVQSDVIIGANYFSTSVSSQAATFTLPVLIHYEASQGTFGAGSTVTNQLGFRATNTLTGATNNYGFYSDIVAGTNRWNFYAYGTADNYMAGSLGIGTTSLTGVNLYVNRNITGAVNSYSVSSQSIIQSDVTQIASYYYAIANTVAATFTLPNLPYFFAGQGTFGAGSAVTNQFGFYIESTLTSATNNYGVYSNIASGTGRWNFYANGTANNYMAGSLGLGSTSLTGYGLRNAKTLTGATTAYGITSEGQIQSGVTTGAVYFQSNASIVAAAFTVPDLVHYDATQGTFGAGVTNQYGFRVVNTLTGATNNYGFWSNIASGTNRWNFYANGTANNYMAGSLGLNSISLTGYGLRNVINITGATTAYGISSEGTIQSGVTNTANYFSTTSSTASTAFTVTNLIHYAAAQGTIGAGSAVTSQVAFFVNANLTGATSNFAFYSDIAAGTNRWNFYANGTANNYMAGSLGLGSTSLTGYGLRNALNITGATSAYGISSEGTIQSSVTNTATYFNTISSTAATAFTVNFLTHYAADQGSFGAGSTVTNQYGFFATAALISATNNYGFYSNIASGTNRWNFYAAGTANNYMAGSLGIGDTSLTGTNLKISKNITGVSNNAYAIYINSTVQSDVTNNSAGVGVFLSTAAAAFTAFDVNMFQAGQGTIGAGSSVTRLFGYRADSTIIGATINYGFFSDIAAGTNRYNFYAAGTADNQFNGKLTVGGLSRTTGALSTSNPFTFYSGNGSYTDNTTAASGTVAHGPLISFRSTGLGATNTNVTYTNASTLYIEGAPTGGTNLTITNPWSLFINTGNVYLGNGAVSVGGGTVSSQRNFVVSRTISGSVGYNIISDGQVLSNTTSSATYYYTQANTQASAFTLTTLNHYLAVQGTFGAGSAVTNQYGYFVDSTLTGATNDYGFYSDIAAGTNRWNFYANGTANNYMAGSLGIGSTTLTGSTVYSLRVGKSKTGATSYYDISSEGTIATDVTLAYVGYSSTPSTQASAFTLGSVYHFYTTGVTVGSGSTVINQFGFRAGSTLNGASNNYGFYGDLTSGTGRYNFYAAGTADNWFSGNVFIGGAGGLGYTTGSGGAVTQATSRTTGVTLNKTNGAITLVSAAGSTAWQTFTVTNSTVAATDVIILSQKSGTDKYMLSVTAVAAGSFNISFATTGGTTTEQPVFNFAVIKAVTA